MFPVVLLAGERRAAGRPAGHRSGGLLQAYACTGMARLYPFTAHLFRHGNVCTPLLQVLLRWAVQQGVPVLPKSSNPERIEENCRIFDFELSKADMERLSSLDCGHKYCWDPSEVA